MTCLLGECENEFKRLNVFTPVQELREAYRSVHAHHLDLASIVRFLTQVWGLDIRVWVWSFEFQVKD